MGNITAFFRQLSFLACTNPYVLARAEVLTLLLSHAAPSSLVGCRGLNPPVKFHDERASLMSYRVSIDGWTASTLAHSFHPVALALSLQKAFFHFLGRMHVRERLFTYEWSQTTGWVRFSSIWGGECTDLVYWVDTKMFSCCQKMGFFFFTQRTCFMNFLTKPGKWTEECITRTDSEKREFLKKNIKSKPRVQSENIYEKSYRMKWVEWYKLFHSESDWGPRLFLNIMLEISHHKNRRHHTSC